MMEAVEITLGRSRRHPQGWRVSVPAPFCDNLGDVLEAHTVQGEVDAWWCPFIFGNDYRKIDNWQGGQVVAIDADFYSTVVKPPKGETRHSRPPQETAAALVAAVEAGSMGATLWHPTPRGARFIFLLDRLVTQPDEMSQVIAGCAALVNEGLIEASLAATLDAKNKPIGGYLADSSTFDLAHFMFCPTAMVDGTKRTGTLIPLSAGAFSVEELGAYVPVARKPATAFINTAKVGEIGRTLAKMDCEGNGNDGSGALMKVARKAIQMGITSAEDFLKEVEAWNARRSEPWLREDLVKRFEDALARWSQEGRVQVAVTKDGKPILTLGSLSEILKGDSLFRDDQGNSLLWFDALKKCVMIGTEPATDQMMTSIRIMIADKYDKTQTVQKEAMRDALTVVSQETQHHPVEDYFVNAEIWDGVPRICHMAKEVFGSSESIHSIYIRKWMISAVARLFEPGCQADGALVLVGDQYIGKGSFFKAVAINEDWHTGSEINLEFKLEDAYRITHSVWIYEVEELDKIYNGRGGAGRLKAFMTQRADTYVEKWESFAKTYKRRFVFGSSANEFDLLRDPTGDRRFWCIPCNDLINYQWVTANVHQLWSEALHAYYVLKEPWHLSHEEDSLRNEANALFRPDNVFESKIEEVLKSLKYPAEVVSADLVRRTASGFGEGNRIPFDLKIAISAVMKRNGYIRKVGRVGGKNVKKWHRATKER